MVEEEGGGGWGIEGSCLQPLPLLALGCHRVDHPAALHVIKKKEDAVVGSLVMVEQLHHMRALGLQDDVMCYY